MLAGDFRHALDHVLGAVQGSGVRQLGEGDQVLLVLLWNEAGRGGGEAHVPQAHQADVDQQGHGTAAQDAPYHANVTMAGAVEHAVERAEQPAAEQSVEQPRETVLGASWALSRVAASAGDRVSELNAEITVEIAMVSANCW